MKKIGYNSGTFLHFIIPSFNLNGISNEEKRQDTPLAPSCISSLISTVSKCEIGMKGLLIVGFLIRTGSSVVPVENCKGPKGHEKRP